MTQLKAIRGAALVTGAIMLALALPASPAVAGSAASVDVAPRTHVSDGTLDWGVKQSFREYVEGPIANGGIEVTPPAKRKADGTFRFADGTGKVDAAADTASLKFKGEVYFYGHDDGAGPQLQLWIDHIRVVIDGAHSVLIADVTSSLFTGGDPVLYDNVKLVVLDAKGVDLKPNSKGVVQVKGIPSTLTSDGSEAFGEFYSEGTPFDDVSFKVKIG